MTAVKDDAEKCPVLNFNYATVQPEGTWRRTYDEQRAQFPWYRNDFGTGYWTFVNQEAILHILQDPQTFSSRSVTPADPDPQYKWIPEMLDGEEHRQWRRQLGPLFAPKAVELLEGTIRQRAAALVDVVAGNGECDFLLDFADRFPTTIFLELMGLPVEELDQFLEWERAILHNAGDEDQTEITMAAMLAVMGRFAEIIAARRQDPRDDIVTKALGYEIDGAPVTDQDLLSFCLLMFMAGLDTVSQTLAWAVLHLARNADDRARINADPGLIPHAVEEFLRVYPIVVPGRKVTKDTEVQGCPLKAGDMVAIPLCAATRDEKAYPNASMVDLDRGRTNHIGFGAGPHRCLGSHLARLELVIAIEEWQKRIPDYQVAPEAELLETGAQLGLERLPLVW